MKKLLYLVPIIALIAYFGWTSYQKSKLPKYEFYWAVGCPHCQNVEDFFKTWDGKNKINIEQREVRSNPRNSQLFNERASFCNIAEDQRGVPLLYTPDQKCLTGDTPIIDYFKNLK